MQMTQKDSLNQNVGSLSVTNFRSRNPICMLKISEFVPQYACISTASWAKG